MSTRHFGCLLTITAWALGCASNDVGPSVLGSGGSTAATTAGGQGGQTSAPSGGNGTSGAAAGGVDSGNGGAATGGVSTGNGGAATGGVSTGNGGAAIGGSSASNGGTSTGGTATGKGGATGNGGASSSGGATGKGGASSSGGATGKGGASSSSGATGKGGAVTGGAPSTGGASASAGSTNTGGAAPGCGLTGAATGVQNLTISVAAQDRSYVLFVPTAYNANAAMPLIFAWHGLGGSGTVARQYFRIEQAAANQAIFVYPTGLPNSSGQTAWTLTQTGIDVQLFDALLADVSNRYCIDRSRVYATGHSYGAMMTNALGCYRGNVLRGIAPVAGMPPFGNPTCTGAVAAWIAHGENDGTVDFTTGGIASRDLWIKLDGCSTATDPVAVDPSPCVAYQGCSSGHPVNWCVHQDDHNWPSFAGAGIWAFFNSLK
jgi:polyhydroxybutyrate depolymerase